MEEDQAEYLKLLSSQLLTPREKNSENFLTQFLVQFDQSHQRTDGTSADLSQQERMEKAEQAMSDCSVILANRFKPILKDFVSVNEKKHLDDKFAFVRPVKQDENLWASNYNRCLNTFLDNSDCVSIQAGNKQALKNINPKDAVVLILWAMNTNRRFQGDNMLSLIVSGKTSCGKRVLFENVLQEVCHNLTGDSGVGRFLLNGKSSVLLHDCDLECLVRGKDVDKFKAIARTESFQTKVHSKTNVIPPTFLMATSNQNLLDHRFAKAEDARFAHKVLYKSEILPGTRIREGDLEAVKFRFLEVFVRQRPTLPENCLPTSGTFSRLHFIRGMYAQVAGILSRLDPSDLECPAMFRYGVAGLAKNVNLLSTEDEVTLKPVVDQLLEKCQKNSL